MDPAPAAASPRSLVGVAIATHNRRELLRECLERLLRSTHSELWICVCDDGSSDGTARMLEQQFPVVHTLRGDGSLWWSGGTNRAIEACLDRGVDHVLLLNPDVLLEPQTVAALLREARRRPGAVVSPVAVDRRDPGRLVWGGCSFGRLLALPPIWSSRYLHRPGSPVSGLPAEPYRSAEVHGRGVLFPAGLFREHGLYDERRLPQYGADIDLSRRLTAAGVELWMVPAVRVLVDVERVGLGDAVEHGALPGYLRYLTDTRQGDALRVWWHLLRRHVPWYALPASYAYHIALNSFRYWQRVARGQRGGETG
jgi:GT2 family glycosyltransferase